MNADPRSPDTAAIREIQEERRIAACLPVAQIAQNSRCASSRPKHEQIEESGIPCAQKRADAMNRRRKQQRQQIAGDEKGFQREHEIDQQG